LSPLASATSSNVVVANEERPIAIPIFLQALAVASSPSECASLCIAVGATPSGTLFLCPKIFTLVSIFDTSRKTLGRMRYLVYASRFSWSVLPESAPYNGLSFTLHIPSWKCCTYLVVVVTSLLIHHNGSMLLQLRDGQAIQIMRQSLRHLCLFSRM
jgi:hypothetical protein